MWILIILWLSAGLSVFTTLKKYELDPHSGLNPMGHVAVFLACIVGWPLFGLFNLIVPR